MGSRMVVVVAAMGAGCGRIAFDPTSQDAYPTGPFGTAVQLPALDTGGADDPALTGDELEITFTSDRAGGVGTCDVWTATRSSTTASWTTPMSLGAPVNTALCESGAFPSVDGLTLWLATRPAGTFDLVESTRATRTSAWQAPVALTALSSMSDDSSPTVTADALVIAFASNRTGVSRLYISSRASEADGWSAPMLVGPLTSGTKERSPHLSRDGLTLWFISDALGTQDIWVASRPDRASSFGTAVVVSELATSDDEDDPWVSGDGHRIYFARYPTTGNPTLWVATR
ncbi:MAG TPA: hypothetical protein VLB44_21630 [Kofleriaceae bacterium]|nr:hypothetical protein [Kofleriaceae bacterium]